MWKAAFSGRSERSEAGSVIGGRKKKSRSGAESGLSTSSRKIQDDDEERRRRRSTRGSSVYGDDDNASSYGTKSRGGLTEGAIRALNETNDDDWEDDDDKYARSERKSRHGEGRERRRKSTRSEKTRSRSRSRSRDRKDESKRRVRKENDRSEVDRRDVDRRDVDRRDVDRRDSGRRESEKSRGKARADPDLEENDGTSRALPPMGSFEQFPGQFAAEPVQPYPVMSGALPSAPNNQFYGQPAPTGARPPLVPSRTDSYGHAAEYYIDEGQSVGYQPGMRPHSPNMLVNPDAHLATPTAAPQPAQDTGNGTAADYYGSAPMTTEPESYIPTGSSKPDNRPRPNSGSQSSKPSKNDNQISSFGSSSGTPSKIAAAAISSTAAANGTPSRRRRDDERRDEERISTYQQTTSYSEVTEGRTNTGSRPQQTSNGPTSQYGPPQQPVYYGPDDQAQTQAQGAGKPPPQSNIPLYAAGAAAAGFAAYEMYEHNQHSAQQSNTNSYQADGAYGQTRPPVTSMGPGPGPGPGQQMNGNGNPSYQQQPYHEHRGPITRIKDGILDLVSTPEDIRRMEDYTEYIGVCKYCFDPRTSINEAPRRHHHHRQRDSFENLRSRRSIERMRRRASNDSLRKSGSIRVDKESRYYNADESRRRRSGEGVLGAGLAAAGVAAGANALFNEGKDFNDTYSVKSGHRERSAARRRSRSSSREQRRRASHGVTSKAREEEWVTVRTKEGKIEKRRVKRKSRSTSRDSRGNGLLGAAAGAALGAGVASVAARSSKRHHSPRAQGKFVRRPSRSSSTSRSRSPGLAEILGFSTSKSAKRTDQKSTNNSYYDISRDSRPAKSDGFFGGFFASPQRGRTERRGSKERRKKKSGFFGFSNSSVSSDDGIAFGEGFASRTNLPLGKKPSRKSSDERIAETIAGIGATAAAIEAAKRSRLGKRTNRQELRKRVDDSSKRNQQSAQSVVVDEDGWEDELPSDGEASSSGDSALAFGGSRLSKRNSLESVSSGDGLSAWGWRWGGKDKKKKRRSSSLSEYQTVHQDAGYDSRQSYPDSREASSTNGPTQPLKYVDPRPLSEDSRYGSMPGAFDDVPVVRPSPGPIQQPKPVSPKRAAFVKNSPDSNGRFSSRPTPTRTQSSPTRNTFVEDAALIGGAALVTAGVIASQNKKSKESSNVRFGLTEEQQQKEDREQYRKQERERRRESERADDERRRADRTRALKEEAERNAREQDAQRREEQVRQRREDENRRAAEAELERRRREDENRRAAEAELERRRREDENRRAAEAEFERRRREDENRRAAEAEFERRRREEENRRAAEAELERRRREDDRLEDERRRQNRDQQARDAERIEENSKYETTRRSDRERSSRKRHEYEGDADRELDRKRQELEDRNGYDIERREEYRRDDRKHSNERSPSQSSNKWGYVAAGAAAAATVGAVVAGYEHEQSKKREEVREEKRRDYEDAYVAKHVTPDDKTSGTPLADDDIFDRDFFKRKRSDSEFARESRQAEIAQKAADKVIADLETRYQEPAQSQADFFVPKDLHDESAEKKTKWTGPNADNDIQVYRAEVRTPSDQPGYTVPPGKNRYAPYGVPGLTIISPTPPPSLAGSVKGKRSRSSSPLARTVDAETTAPIDAETKESRRKSVNWGDDEINVYEAQTPEPLHEEDSYMTARDRAQTEDSKFDEVVQDESYPHTETNTTTYREDLSTVDHKEANNDAHQKLPLYQQPSYESVSDIGIAIGSRETEGAPPAQGFVEGEGNGNTPSEEMPHVPGGFDNEVYENKTDEPVEEANISAWEPLLSKKEQKKREKAAARTSTAESGPDTTAVDPEPSSWDISAEPETSEWALPLSKKEQKKKDKEAKRNTLTSNEPMSPAVETELDASPPDAPAEPETAEWEPPLSKKDKKKREKANKRSSTIDSAADTSAIEQEPTEAPVVEQGEAGREPPLSKKEQKKRDKSAKLDEKFESEAETPAFDREIGPSQEVTVAQEDSTFAEPLTKKEKKKLGKVAQLAEAFESDSSRSMGEKSTSRDASLDRKPSEDAWEPPLSKKEQKKREKAAKRASIMESQPDSSAIEREEEPLKPEPLEEPAWEPPLSKKEKKKREKESKRDSFAGSNPAPELNDEMADEEAKFIAMERALEDDKPPEEAAWEPPLTKKEKKKREKELKRNSMAGNSVGDSSPPPELDDDMADEEAKFFAMEQAMEENKPFEDVAPKLSGKEEKKADKEAKKNGFGDVAAALMTAGGIAALASARDDKENDSSSSSGKKSKKGKKKKLGEPEANRDIRDIEPTNDQQNEPSSMPGGWDIESRDSEPDQKSNAADPFDYQIKDDQPSKDDQLSSPKEADPWSQASDKKSKKKKKRDSGLFNEPTASSPLRTEWKYDDYMGDPSALSNKAQDDESHANESKTVDDGGVSMFTDDPRVTDSPRRVSPEDGRRMSKEQRRSRSVFSEPGTDTKTKRGSTIRVVKAASEAGYYEEPESYEGRSPVVASEPVDPYERVENIRRRSKIEDDDDNASVVSSRSRKSRDDSALDKKEKKGGFFGLFSRKSVDTGKPDGASLSRQSTRESRHGDEEDGEKRRRHKHRESSLGGENDDDTRSTSGSRHRRHRSRDERDDDARSTTTTSESRHRRGDEDGREHRRSRIRVEDLPPLPVSSPQSPAFAPLNQEQGDGNPASAKPDTPELVLEPVESLEVTTSEEPKQDPASDHSKSFSFLDGTSQTDHSAKLDWEDEVENPSELLFSPTSLSAQFETPQRPGVPPPASIAVPLRFPFGTMPRAERSASRTERSTSFGSPSAITSPQSPSSQKQKSRPPSTEFKPLYLVEKNRKPVEVEQSLPSLPSSKPSSRASSINGSEVWHSAAEDPGSPQSSRELKIDINRANLPRRQSDLLNSAETTPKASDFPRTARAKAQFYTWEDFAQDERLHEQHDDDNSHDFGDPLEKQDYFGFSSAEALPALPSSRPESPTERIDGSTPANDTLKTVAAMTGIAGVAAVAVAIFGNHQNDKESSDASKDVTEDKALHSAAGSPDVTEASVSDRSWKKKKGKKGKKQADEDEASPIDAAEPAQSTTTEGVYDQSAHAAEQHEEPIVSTSIGDSVNPSEKSISVETLPGAGAEVPSNDVKIDDTPVLSRKQSKKDKKKKKAMSWAAFEEDTATAEPLDRDDSAAGASNDTTNTIATEQPMNKESDLIPEETIDREVLGETPSTQADIVHPSSPKPEQEKADTIDDFAQTTSVKLSKKAKKKKQKAALEQSFDGIPMESKPDVNAQDLAEGRKTEDQSDLALETTVMPAESEPSDAKSSDPVEQPAEMTKDESSKRVEENEPTEPAEEWPTFSTKQSKKDKKKKRKSQVQWSEEPSHTPEAVLPEEAATDIVASAGIIGAAALGDTIDHTSTDHTSTKPSDKEDEPESFPLPQAEDDELENLRPDAESDSFEIALDNEPTVAMAMVDSAAAEYHAPQSPEQPIHPRGDVLFPENEISQTAPTAPDEHIAESAQPVPMDMDSHMQDRQLDMSMPETIAEQLSGEDHPTEVVEQLDPPESASKSVDPEIVNKPVDMPSTTDEQPHDFSWAPATKKVKKGKKGKKAAMEMPETEQIQPSKDLESTPETTIQSVDNVTTEEPIDGPNPSADTPETYPEPEGSETLWDMPSKKKKGKKGKKTNLETPLSDREQESQDSVLESRTVSDEVEPPPVSDIVDSVAVATAADIQQQQEPIQEQQDSDNLWDAVPPKKKKGKKGKKSIGENGPEVSGTSINDETQIPGNTEFVPSGDTAVVESNLADEGAASRELPQTTSRDLSEANVHDSAETTTFDDEWSIKPSKKKGKKGKKSFSDDSPETSTKPTSEEMPIAENTDIITPGDTPATESNLVDEEASSKELPQANPHDPIETSALEDEWSLKPSSKKGKTSIEDHGPEISSNSTNEETPIAENTEIITPGDVAIVESQPVDDEANLHDSTETPTFDDEWSTKPSKKKGKKGKKSFSDDSPETSTKPTSEEMPMVENSDIITPDEIAVAESKPVDDEANLPESTETATLDDEWSIKPTKKNGKKGKRVSSVVPSEEHEPIAPLDSTALVEKEPEILPSVDDKPAIEENLPNQNTSEAADDEWGVPISKKKGKKGKRSSVVPSALVENEPEILLSVDDKPAIEENLPNQNTLEAADDEWGVPISKKKGKKGKRSSVVPSALVENEPEILPSVDDKPAIEENLPNQNTLEAADDEWGVPISKKKGKKGKKSSVVPSFDAVQTGNDARKVDTPAETVTTDPQDKCSGDRPEEPASAEQIMVDDIKANETNIAAVLEPMIEHVLPDPFSEPPVNPNEMPVQTENSVNEIIQESSTSGGESTLLEPGFKHDKETHIESKVEDVLKVEDVPPEPLATESTADEEWAPQSSKKKSKKSKKSKALSWDTAEPETIITESLESTEEANKSIDLTPEVSKVDNETITQPATEGNAADDFGFAAADKKKKKGKKNKSISWEPEGEPEPVVENDLDTFLPTTLDDNLTKAPGPEVSDIGTSEDAVPETGAADDWSNTAATGKKKKKNKNDKLVPREPEPAPPVETIPALQDVDEGPREVFEMPNTFPDNENDVQPAQPEEELSFSAKKSKKDKKKAKKSRLSSDPWIDSTADESAPGLELQEADQQIAPVVETEALSSDLKLDEIQVAEEVYKPEPSISGNECLSASKQSKKDKKKAKKNRLSSDPWIDSAADESAPGLELQEADQQIAPVVETEAMSLDLNSDEIQVAEEADKPEPSTNENEFLSASKQSKKDKKKAKKNRSADIWSDTPADDTRTQSDLKDDFLVRDNSVDSTSATIKEAPQDDDDGMSGFSRKKSKKEKKKAKRQSEAFMEESSISNDQPISTEQPMPEPLDVESQAGNSTIPQEGDSLPDHTAAELDVHPENILRDEKLEAQSPVVPMGEIEAGRESAVIDKEIRVSRHSDPSQDLEFAATLAAALADSGFDPSLVVNDPTFHRRDSPPGVKAEADPEEVFAPAKNKKGKKGKMNRNSSGLGDEKPLSDPEQSEKISSDDFDAIISQGLTGTGFDPKLLEQATSSSKEVSSAEVEGDASDFGYSTQKKKKGKKGKKSAFIDFTTENPAIEDSTAINEKELLKDHEVVPSSSEAISPALTKTDNMETLQDSSVFDAPVDNSGEIDVNDTSFGISKKKEKRNKKKQQRAEALLAEEPQSPAEATISLAAEETKDVSVDQSRVLDSENAATTSRIQGLFPELQRVKYRKPSPTISEDAERTRRLSSNSGPAGFLHTSEVSQFLPVAVGSKSQPEQLERGTPPQEHDSVAEGIAVGAAAAAGAAIGLGTESQPLDRAHETDWSFASLNEDKKETHHSPPHTRREEHEIVRDSGYQEGDNTPIESTECGDSHLPQIRTIESRESLRSRRSASPLHIATDTGPSWNLTPARQREEDDSSKLLAHTPLQSTTKERASPLFRSGEDTQTETSGQQAVESDRSGFSPRIASPSNARSALESITEEIQPLKRTKSPGDLGSPEHVKALDRNETPQGMRRTIRERPSLSSGFLGSKTVSKQVSTEELLDRLASPAMEEDSDRIRALKHRSSKRRVSDQRPPSAMSNQSGFSSSQLRSPIDDLRSFSRTSNRSSTPTLRRIDRSMSGDLRAASRRGSGSAAGARSPITIPFEPPPTPPSNDDDVIHASAARTADMDDIFQGYGGAQKSELSPTRPPGVRKRKSMHGVEMNTLVAENRSLQDARDEMGRSRMSMDFDPNSMRATIEARDLELREKDAEINQIRAMLEPLQGEIDRLKQINGDLTEANRNLVDDANGRYGTLQSEYAHAHEQWQSATRELEITRSDHEKLTSSMRETIEAATANALADKNAEILRLREELDVATEQIRALQVQIQSSRKIDFLTVRDEDYFDGSCQKLCQHVQQWVLRFSKLSDNRVSRLSDEIKDEKIELRLDNAILDGSDVDKLLSDRIRRRDVFMSVVMTMVWEYVFTRYLFGMDREQRQKLKALEKILAEVGPPRAVAQWRATTLTLLSKRPDFAAQCQMDTEAVAHEIFEVLCALLPPPSNTRQQLLTSLQKVIGLSVDISIEMRTQRAEFIMLPPLQPEYDTNGDLVRKVHFNASLMNERSGLFSSNEELEHQRAVVKIVLFPLVVKKGDESGEGEEEIVVCPAQVLVHNDGGRGKKVVRVMSGAMEIDDPRRSRMSLVSTAGESMTI
ncbi:Hypothetical protein R9X50_00317400 [Acrodontium crateriforme]|uniref:Involucrin repeat protein n=1 Tax=Acrodontium crateriforme TaxID=150365 RepID=A0AAQ3M320_9PEZI|nr:Hypothetical protein R9X50_00317400 [Acrodontium crateriforme]